MCEPFSILHISVIYALAKQSRMILLTQYGYSGLINRSGCLNQIRFNDAYVSYLYSERTCIGHWMDM